MKKFIAAGFVVFTCAAARAQTPPPAQTVLAQAIAYHDPQNRFLAGRSAVELAETRPDGQDRHTRLQFDFPAQRFHATSKIGNRALEYIVHGDSGFVRIDGSAEISAADREAFRLQPGRPVFMRNYYTYLYGLPMKLRDPGTVVHPRAKNANFHGHPAHAVKVTYEKGVGADTWYFYFDPGTHALIGYEFYHDEPRNDGEYILLEGEIGFDTIRLPKVRQWYRHGDNKYLGTDEIVAAGRLP